MTDLYLKLTNDDGSEEEILIESDRFVIGRHSGCDLCVKDSRLSRRHLQIERFGAVLVASDLGSSNGTKLNGSEMTEPAALSAGDELDLGGVKIIVASEEDDAEGDSGSGEQAETAPPTANPAVSSAGQSAGGESIFSNPLLLAPVLGVLLLVVIGLGIGIYSLAAGSGSGRDNAGNGGPPFPEDTYDPLDSTPETTPVTDGSPTTNGSSLPGSTPLPEIPNGSPAPTVVDSDTKVREAVIAFLRSIAQRDPNPVITSEPLKLVSNRIDGLRGSTALASNIENARRDAAKIKALAASKNLRPDFVAAAAIAQLGGRAGDVHATASSMIEPLSKLKIQIGDAFANESVIIVAAYDQGTRGEFLAMRDTMTRLTDSNPTISSRKVRTVWFLREQGKLSDAQFNRAVLFIAVGAVSKDPQSFGVNAQPLNLN